MVVFVTEPRPHVILRHVHCRRPASNCFRSGYSLSGDLSNNGPGIKVAADGSLGSCCLEWLRLLWGGHRLLHSNLLVNDWSHSFPTWTQFGPQLLYLRWMISLSLGQGWNKVASSIIWLKLYHWLIATKLCVSTQVKSNMRELRQKVSECSKRMKTTNIWESQ